MSNRLIETNNSKIKSIQKQIYKIAPYDTSVLFMGESGVGKSEYARMIHRESHRKDGPLIIIDCGAIPANLLESELFGYEKGAFTGAISNGKKGLIEMGDKGTVFLDEIGELPPTLQVKLLKVLQDKKIMRVGGTAAYDIDFRLISATNRNLKEEVKSGEFRKDLYYRINVITIEIPPLRERKDDIEVFATHFCNMLNSKYNTNKEFSPECLEIMTKYSWPGNIRELQNVIEALVITLEEDIIDKESLPNEVLAKLDENSHGKYEIGKMPLKTILEMVEREIILEAYEKYKTTTKVAEILGISQASVSLKLKKYKD